METIGSFPATVVVGGVFGADAGEDGRLSGKTAEEASSSIEKEMSSSGEASWVKTCPVGTA